MMKIQVNERLYKDYVNKEIAKILNKVLSPYSHTHTHLHMRVHMHTHAH